MQIEIRELELRYAGLRIVEPRRQARLESSLAREGQQSAVLAVKTEDGALVLVDGYRRVAALQRLGRDVVEVALLPMEEAAALVEVWRLEAARRRTALEDAWLLAELLVRHGRSQAELATMLNRSKSWVSGRLALVRALPEPVQQAVRTGTVPAQGAMKSLVPLARANAEHCERLVEALGREPVSVRQLGRLYATWRAGDAELRERLVSHPRLFLKADEAVSGEQEADAGLRLAADLEAVAGLCGKVRRRVREGAFARANTASRATARRSWRETRLVFESLSELMEKEVDRAGSGDPHRDPAPAP
ncbi:MAG: ParB/RepB/Spo0J family partition protein [Proteobacteria bacterium]|nr:ParB/RepB/Spo0J family partition protein [Pseudomonadota bacterium]